MRTRAWCTTLVVASLAVACGDQPTEVVPDRDEVGVPEGQMTQGPGMIALATSSSDDGLSITTDKDDYAPGDTVWFTGAGWPANDVLDIVLTDQPLTHPPLEWTVNVGEDGTFRDSTYVVDEGDLDVMFTLVATSRATGRSLTVTFTDGNIRVNGTPLGVTFDLIVEKFGTSQNPSLTCGGTLQDSDTESITGVSGQGANVGGINGNESFRLTAALTSISGGGFRNWSPAVGTTGGSGNSPYTEIGLPVPPATTSRTICVPGFAGGGNSGNYTANYTPVPDLRIIKTRAPTSFTVGSNATFTLAVSNIGQLATSGTVTVEDILPTGLTFVSVVATGWTCSGTSTVSCTRSNALAPGAAYPNIVITVTPTAAAVPSVANTGSVSGGGDVSSGNNSSTVNVTVVGLTDLSIIKSHTDNFTRGTNESYTLEVSNVGSAATSAAVTVTDTLPAGLTFVSGTGTGWNACTATGQIVSCVRPLANPIASGATAPAITLTVGVGGGTASAITNRGRVSGGGESAPNLVACDGSHNNCDADPTTVVNANAPPVANNDSYSVNEDNTLSKNAAAGVLANDTDADNNTLTATIVSNPDPAKTQSFTFNAADGSFDFEPKPDFHGTVTFTYKASDGIAESGVATVTITVVSVNDAPTFTKGEDQEVNEDSGPHTVNGWATDISAGAANESGQALTFTVTNDNNTLFSAQPAINLSTGTLTFTPAADAFGSAVVTVKLKDDGGTANGGVDETTQTFTIEVLAVNDAPSFTKGDDQEVLEDSGPHSVSGWATGISAGPANEAGQTLTFMVTGNTNPGLFSSAPSVAGNGTLSFTSAPNANGSATITIALKDNGGTANGGDDTSDPQTFVIKVVAVNDAPSFEKGDDQTVNEGSSAQTLSGWATDISAGPANESGQTLSFVVTNSNNSLFSAQPAVSATGTLTFTPAAGPNGTAVVTVKLKDDGGTDNGGVDETTKTFNITVNNVAPTILTLILPIAPIQVGTLVNLSATFSDPGTADVHTALIDWEDGTSNGIVNEATQAVSGSHVYALPGIYTVTLTVTDDHASDIESFQYVVVYDPSAGFVTGGGWINSPAYACPVFCGGATGKANFGFVSKYHKGATVPSGNTEFQFHAGNLNFKSTIYEWLVVQGTSKATYKGEGTINGEGQYAFLLSAIDNGSSGDRFRIKIWDKVSGALVYDNQSSADGLSDTADPTTTIAGGNIVIHTGKK